MTACNYGNDGDSNVPHQRGQGVNNAGIRSANGTKSGKGQDLYVMSSIGLTIEKLEEDYLSQDNGSVSGEESDDDRFAKSD